MSAYKIVITPDAEADLIDLRDYISNVLLARDTARNYIRRIRKEIGTLSEMPARNRLVDDEPWHTYGVRWMIVNNFYVYYRVDESARNVFVLNIVYARRDQLRVLNQIRMD